MLRIYGVPTECRRERKSLLSFMRLLLAESKVDFPLFIINLENLETIYSRYLYFFFSQMFLKKDVIHPPSHFYFQDLSS